MTHTESTLIEKYFPGLTTFLAKRGLRRISASGDPANGVIEACYSNNDIGLTVQFERGDRGIYVESPFKKTKQILLTCALEAVTGHRYHPPESAHIAELDTLYDVIVVALKPANFERFKAKTERAYLDAVGHLMSPQWRDEFLNS